MRHILVLTLVAFLVSSGLCADAPKPLESVAKVSDLLAAIKDTKAKVIVLNMWGITCSPCIAEMPVFERVAQKLKDNPNIAFMGLCIPEDGGAKEKIPTSAASIVQTRGVKYRNLVWSGTADALLEKFQIDGTPYTVIVAADGKELAVVKVPLDAAKAFETLEKSVAAALEKISAGAQK